MKKVLTALIVGSLVAVSPCFAQASDDGYDLSTMEPGSESAGLSQFRITPDMFPKHSYHRMELMKKYGPRGKAIGFSTIQGKAFDYLNPQTLQNKRNMPKASDPYLDNAYEAPTVNGNYDSAYQPKKSYSSSLKPLGSKHNLNANPFANAGSLFTTGNSSSAKPFNGRSYDNKFSSPVQGQSSDNAQVFDDESMF